MQADTLNRRAMFGGLGLALAPLPALAQSRPRSDLHFEVWRSGHQIGSHRVSFRGDDHELVAEIEAEMRIKLGPVPLFDYRHHGTETWRGGRFASLETRSVTNGRVEQVSAERTDAGVAITTGPGKTLRASTQTCPLTHWNAGVFEGAMFNPQTGAILRETIARSVDTVSLDGRSVGATCYRIRGDAEIADWYDPAGTWIALRGKASDGSSIEYKRV